MQKGKSVFPAAAALAMTCSLLTAQATAQAPAQAPAAPAAPTSRPAGPDDVVATVEGDKLTPRRIAQIRASLPPQFQQVASKMDNRAFVKSYGELFALSKLAEQEKLNERGPYKDQFAFLRMNFLAQAYLDYLNTRIEVKQEDAVKYYEEHKGDYQEAHVKAIYIAFSPAGAPAAADPQAKKSLTEAQAKAKAENLAAQLRKGADFAKLAKEHSDDTASAEKGGDIGPIKGNAAGIPAEVKDLIFKMRPGDVSDPVRHPAGFYLFKLEKIHTDPLEQVIGNIATRVQGLKVQEEINRILASIKITYDNESYFSNAPAAAPEQPAPPVQPPAARP
jgi:peptidyl-prolyl cis-trans isomerase C